MNYRSTRQVEALLGVNNLAVRIAQGRYDPPDKSPQGQYLWTSADIDRISWAVRRKSADDVLPELRAVTRQ